MRITAKYIGVINIALLVGFTYLLADLASLFIGQRLEVNPALPPVESLTATSGQARPTREVYRAILERNIFNLRPVSSIASLESSVPVQRLPMRMKLVGTVAGDPERSFAVMQDLATKEDHLYRLGDPVAENGKLAEITRNQVVVLREGGIRETLEVIWTERGTQRPPEPSRRKSTRPRPSSFSGQDHWVLDKQEVVEALQNLPQLLTKARVIPHLTADGKNEGFRIVAIKPDSFYQRIGLKNGDVIQRINGVEVKDPATFMSIFNQLKNESNITMDLIRGNKKETFSYEIR